MAYEQGLLKGDLNAVRSRLLACKLQEDQEGEYASLERLDSQLRLLIRAINPDYAEAIDRYEREQEQIVKSEKRDWGSDPQSFEESLSQLGGLEKVLANLRAKERTKKTDSISDEEWAKI